MTPEQARLKACLQAAASILYEEIEQVVRNHLLHQVEPEIGNFLSQQLRKPSEGESERSKAASES
jgi:microcompartment protein CcmL/EutN